MVESHSNNLYTRYGSKCLNLILIICTHDKVPSV